jgi:hypothetical protein
MREKKANYHKLHRGKWISHANYLLAFSTEIGMDIFMETVKILV